MFSNKHFFRNMNGILVVNKEKGFTSRDIVNIVSKILGTKKVGHTGTLDPIAEGVLVLTVGKCTKLCDYLISDDKEYIAEFKLGCETDTLDNTGIILKTSDKLVSDEEIIKVINSFVGEYNQEVPKYSAVKINGKKLYEYARNNEDITLPSRLVNIKSIEMLELNDTIKIKCLVSKGTYIRSLIRDIGLKLGTYATMTNLLRTKQGMFKIEDSYSIEDIKNNNYKIINVEELFVDYPKIELNINEYKKISNGCLLDNNYNSDFVLFYYNDSLVSIYKNVDNKIKPFIMF